MKYLELLRQKIKFKPKKEVFTKKMLSSGDIVKLRNNKICLYVENAKIGDKCEDVFMVLEDKRGFVLQTYFCLSNYREDLSSKTSIFLDVQKVSIQEASVDNVIQLVNKDMCYNWDWEREEDNEK